VTVDDAFRDGLAPAGNGNNRLKVKFTGQYHSLCPMPCQDIGSGEVVHVEKHAGNSPVTPGQAKECRAVNLYTLHPFSEIFEGRILSFICNQDR
jgi:hypothetical protein